MYQVSYDKDGNGWKVGGIVTEETMNKLVENFIIRGWVVKVEKVN